MLAGTRISVGVNRLGRTDGRVRGSSMIIRREWRWEGVKQTAFICVPTQSLSKWPLPGFDCTHIPPVLNPPHPPPPTPHPSSLTSDSLANVVTARYGIKRRQGRKLSDQSPPMLRGYTADGPFQENRHPLSRCDLLILNCSDRLQKTDKVLFNCFIQPSISHSGLRSFLAFPPLRGRRSTCIQRACFVHADDHPWPDGWKVPKSGLIYILDWLKKMGLNATCAKTWWQEKGVT